MSAGVSDQVACLKQLAEVELGFIKAAALENGCRTAWLFRYHLSQWNSPMNIFGEVEGDVQPLHLSLAQMRVCSALAGGELRQRSTHPCVSVWGDVPVVEFKVSVLLRGHLLSDEQKSCLEFPKSCIGHTLYCYTAFRSYLLLHSPAIWIIEFSWVVSDPAGM